MDAHSISLKKCSVMLEPITPKLQTSLSAELFNVIEEKNLFTVRSKKKLLTDLQELKDQNTETERANRKGKAIEELLSSECTYIHHLKVIQNFFMKPIKEQGILSADDYSNLFGNIPTIVRLSEELLGKLKESDNIAEVFIELAPFMKVYSTYAYYYKKSLKVFLNPGKHAALFKFLELQESRPEVQQKLSALLIAPVQRVPRYCLLLQQILDNTNMTDKSYILLKESLKKVQEVVEYIDVLVGFQENAERLIELQYCFKSGYPSIIKADRKLIKEGIVKIASEHIPSQKKYFILLTDIIIYCSILKRDINNTNSLKCKGILPVNKCEIKKVTNRKFEIKCNDVVMTISVRDINECQCWIDVIGSTIRIAKECKSSLRKESSSRRPAVGKLVGEYQEIGISPGIPRRKRQLDFDYGTDKFLPTKRQCIGTAKCLNGTNATVPKINLPDYIDPQGQDSLFPLRQRLGERNVRFANSSREEYKDQRKTDPEVYVFGSNNQNRGFGFKLTSIFNGIGKSLRKWFGFKEH